jgi:hypothetical protein
MTNPIHTYTVDFRLNDGLPSWWSNYINRNEVSGREDMIKRLAQENIIAKFPSFNNRSVSFLSEEDFVIFKLKWS